MDLGKATIKINGQVICTVEKARIDVNLPQYYVHELQPFDYFSLQNIQWLAGIDWGFMQEEPQAYITPLPPIRK